MHPRFDPACAPAQDLDKAHARQRRLMLEGKTEGRLATVLRETQEKQSDMHIATCPRCMSFDPRCSECGFDPRFDRHGWMCSRQVSRWTDVFPWNWRSKKAPAAPVPVVNHGADTPSRPAAAPAPRPASPPPARRVAANPEPHRVSPYAILGVTPSASEEEVRAAFRDKARQYHPDKVAHLGPELRTVAERKMREINQAYEMIRATWGSPKSPGSQR